MPVTGFQVMGLERNVVEHEPSPSERARKRARYTSIACNECKRRKLKCSGGEICTRCDRDNVTCIYDANRSSTHPSEFKDPRVGPRFHAVDQQLESLQRQIKLLSNRLVKLESSSPQSIVTPKSSEPSGLHRILNAPKSPHYIGPTSAEFGLHQHQNASAANDQNHDEDVGISATPSPAASDVESNLPVAASTASALSLSLEDTLNLVQIYEDSVGIMYPCVDLDSVREYVHEYYRTNGIYAINSASEALAQDAPDQDWFTARDIQVLKIILATALLAESHGRSEFAAQLADSVEDRFASRFKVAEVDMKEIVIMTLLSIFHSYRDDEIIAWRMIRIASSATMELGLHRQETWQRTGGVFPGEVAWTWARRLFWCIYVLDRKWSFGSGLPFGIQDIDIDTNLPEPGDSTPYLTCMISHARLSTKIWGLIMDWPNRSRVATSDQCAYLDTQVQHWFWSIPSELRFDSTQAPDSIQQTEDSEHKNRRLMLQVLLALQGNQLRILVYRQNLLSSEHIMENPQGASTAVETAKRTIHILEHFSQVSHVYFQRPEPFNYFLISALAALLLAVLHAPHTFRHVCRPEFYTATELVRRSATRAQTSRRLQKIIRSLKQIKLHKGNSKREQTALGQQLSEAKKIADDHQPTTSQNPLARAQHVWDFAPTLSNPVQQRQAYDVSESIWSTGQSTIDTEPNMCEDLSSFFETAGELYFDPRTSDLPSDVDMGFFAPTGLPPSNAVDIFEADNEALTRVMADLL
ncbi:uncharacterized protein N7469_004285 [Penicillium citrinum]|uniref:Zn(2)-C6 fungal-type domain-containing protein n=2 Tax=Penicillium TaxID=5073 RepID=A0A9W9TQM9_PENCI|nr:uncharacterized protein N7469_004285 [Penicillium citrinum]KAJ5235117.1 hypothetical protein N7469_004285 [Penicillium citrinum]KAJ5590735.1 hypothetical protein N7450_004707 [Penicillium hetheringtonii]